MTTDPRIGSELAGYRIEGVLGRGGMGVVYLATHVRLGRRVALKLLAPDLASDERFRDRFVRESRIAAGLDHPNVIPVYEAGEAGGVLYIAMRYVGGTDLKTLIRQEGPLDPARALALLAQVAAALDAAHAEGLVHRDVKPGNVLLTSHSGRGGEHVYLTDFGLTKRTTSDSGITGTGQFVGTLDYAAPEQFEGKPLDARTDVYSLGAVAYECLTGSLPFPRDQDAAVMFAHLKAPPPAATQARPDLPGAVDPVIARAMAKDPDERYPTAGELVEALGEALGVAGATPAPSSAVRRDRRRSLVLASGVVAAIAALAVWASVASGGRGEAPQSTQTPSSSASPSASTSGVPVALTGTVAKINPVTSQVTGSLDVPAQATHLAAGGGSLWITDSNGDITQLDEETQEVLNTFEVGGQLAGITYSAEGPSRGVWVANEADASVSRIDYSSGGVRTLPLANGADQVAAKGEQVWAVDRDSATVSNIDPLGIQVISAFSVDGAVEIAISGDTAWLLTTPVECVPGNCYFVATLSVLNAEGSKATTLGAVWTNNGGTARNGLAVSGDIVWVMDPYGNEVVRAERGQLGRVNPQKLDRIVVTPHQREIVLDATGNPWVIADFSKITYRISSVNEAVTPVSLPGQPLSISADESGVYVLVRNAG